ncbi:MAG: ABC-F family ATP-binding cassette domain-containing protein [bacterium]
MLSCHHITKSFDGEVTLADISFSLNRGEKIGVVGKNGSGKSTLLKIIAGKLEADSGDIVIAPRTSIGYLSQEIPNEELESTAREYLTKSNQTSDEEKLCSAMQRVGLLPEMLDRTIATLSGGEKNKISIARIFLSAHDIYLLDEPTNNLDLAAVQNIENFIAHSKSAFLIVSHDRCLLDRLCVKTLEINDITHAAIMFDGGFTKYYEERVARLQKQWENYEDFTKEAGRLKQTAATKMEWMREGVANPRVTDNDKYIAGFRSDQSARLSSVARNIERRLERLEKVEKPFEQMPMKLNFSLAERSGSGVANIKQTLITRGNHKLGPINFQIQYGERIVIIGENGVGKTSLLKLLTGEIQPTSGEVRLGASLAIGYLPQEPIQNNNNSVIKEALTSTRADEVFVRQTINRAGLDTEVMSRKVKTLSPGMRSRLILAKLSINPINCLILDEPSNHLDLEILETLENAVLEFKGTLIVVTHDRYFIKKITPTRVLELKSDGSLHEINDLSTCLCRA